MYRTHLFNLLWEGGGEEHGLPIGPHVLHDHLDLRLEPHVEHPNNTHKYYGK